MPPHADESDELGLVTPRQGFLAMIRFLEALAERAGPDFATLMADLEIQGAEGH